MKMKNMLTRKIKFTNDDNDDDYMRLRLGNWRVRACKIERVAAESVKTKSEIYALCCTPIHFWQ